MHKLFKESKTERIVDDFKNVIEDAEALLEATSSQGGEVIAEIRAKAEKSLADAKAGILETQDLVIEKSKEAAKKTDHFVHENPWISIGTAAAIGVVIGMLIARK